MQGLQARSSVLRLVYSRKLFGATTQRNHAAKPRSQRSPSGQENSSIQEKEREAGIANAIDSVTIDTSQLSCSREILPPEVYEDLDFVSLVCFLVS